MKRSGIMECMKFSAENTCSAFSIMLPFVCRRVLSPLLPLRVKYISREFRFQKFKEKMLYLPLLDLKLIDSFLNFSRILRPTMPPYLLVGMNNFHKLEKYEYSYIKIFSSNIEFIRFSCILFVRIFGTLFFWTCCIRVRSIRNEDSSYIFFRKTPHITQSGCTKRTHHLYSTCQTSCLDRDIYLDGQFFARCGYPSQKKKYWYTCYLGRKCLWNTHHQQ